MAVTLLRSQGMHRLVILKYGFMNMHQTQFQQVHLVQMYVKIIQLLHSQTAMQQLILPPKLQVVVDIGTYPKKLFFTFGENSKCLWDFPQTFCKVVQ